MSSEELRRFAEYIELLASMDKKIKEKAGKNGDDVV
jgi:hypothetical protein